MSLPEEILDCLRRERSSVRRGSRAIGVIWHSLTQGAVVHCVEEGEARGVKGRRHGDPISATPHPRNGLRSPSGSPRACRRRCSRWVPPPVKRGSSSRPQAPIGRTHRTRNPGGTFPRRRWSRPGRSTMPATLSPPTPRTNRRRASG